MTEFEKAFAAARKAGKKTFTWKGKEYNTKLKDTKKKKSSFKPGITIKSSIDLGKHGPATIQKKLGGFRNTGANWIESSNISIDD